MESPIHRRAGLVRLLRMDLHNLLRRRGGRVQANDMDGRHGLALIGRGDGQLQVPNHRRAGEPGRAEDGILVAVEDRELRPFRVGGQHGGGFVPCGFHLAALAGA